MTVKRILVLEWGFLKTKGADKKKYDNGKFWNKVK